ncbi:MAG: class I SAM-dependent methyltransferase [Phycisphaerales bacterium]|nr:class I SAM-dependent methyltransferase [Phycisphaerales bacterium]
MDIACGSGRDAVWLAMQGYEVDGLDVLPDALERASDLAHRHGSSSTPGRRMCASSRRFQ